MSSASSGGRRFHGEEEEETEAGSKVEDAMEASSRPGYGDKLDRKSVV